MTLLGILVVGTIILVALQRLGILGSGFRVEALNRLFVGGLWFIIATPLIIAVWIPVAVIITAIDLIAQAIFGSEIVPGTNLLFVALMWYVKNVEWAIVGKGSFDPLPYV